MKAHVLLTLAALGAALSLAAGARATTLQSVYDAAGPGEGYDKLLVLDPAVIYTGGFAMSDLRCCIHGNGAVIDLGPEAEILATGIIAVLDVDHCVIVNGKNGLHYNSSMNPGGVVGIVCHNTFYGNATGIRAFYTGSTGMRIFNNIIAAGLKFGIYARQDYEPAILYNDVWGNARGGYIEQCG